MHSFGNNRVLNIHYHCGKVTTQIKERAKENSIHEYWEWLPTPNSIREYSLFNWNSEKVHCFVRNARMIADYFFIQFYMNRFSIYLVLKCVLSFIFISTIPLKIAIFHMVWLFSVSLTSANLVIPHLLPQTHKAKGDPEKWKLFLLQSFCSNIFSKTFTWSNFK